MIFIPLIVAILLSILSFTKQPENKLIAHSVRTYARLKQVLFANTNEGELKDVALIWGLDNSNINDIADLLTYCNLTPHLTTSEYKALLDQVIANDQEQISPFLKKKTKKRNKQICLTSMVKDISLHVVNRIHVILSMMKMEVMDDDAAAI